MAGTRFPGGVHPNVELAHSLNVQVMAEVTRTERQFCTLRPVRCDYGQGHLFACSPPPDDLPGRLARHVHTD